MSENPLLKVGDVAPDFTLASDEGTDVTLTALRGQKVVLYFYPKDMTPGCTGQACDFRDQKPYFAEKGYQVVGISPDSIKSHATFRGKHELNFTLLADPEHTVARAYGVFREKVNYGKTYEGIVRSTFLIDEQGRLTAIYDNVRAKGHVERLVRELASA